MNEKFDKFELSDELLASVAGGTGDPGYYDAEGVEFYAENIKFVIDNYIDAADSAERIMYVKANKYAFVDLFLHNILMPGTLTPEEENAVREKALEYIDSL